MSVQHPSESRMTRTASTFPRSQEHYMAHTAQRYNSPITASPGFINNSAYRSVSPSTRSPFPDFSNSSRMPSSTRSFMEPSAMGHARMASTRSFMEPSAMEHARMASTRSPFPDFPSSSPSRMASTRAYLDHEHLPYTATDFSSPRSSMPRCANQFLPQYLNSSGSNVSTRSQFPLPVFPNYNH